MKIKTILVKPQTPPAVVFMENRLENLQEAVGGYIDMLNLFDDDVDIILNDEGKLIGLPPNKILMYNGKVIDMLSGNLLITGVDKNTGDTISIPEDKIDKYLKIFSNSVIGLDEYFS